MPPNAAATPRLELRAVTKYFGAICANDSIDLAVLPGEIHAVLGQNGAGKSTLMKIIFGVLPHDAGAVFWDGRPVHIDSPAAARRLGVGMVFQHFALFDSLNAVENVALGLRQRPARCASRVLALAQEYDLLLPLDRPTGTLSMGERQRVELLRCLMQDPQLIILDEPTAVLSAPARDRLFATLRRLAEQGRSILFISHKLDEIRALCQRVTVLRAGRVVARLDARASSSSELARHMLGEQLSAPPPPRALTRGAPRLRLVQLELPASSDNPIPLAGINLSVHGGEIVGIAGISGNGQQALAAACAGERRALAPGQVVLDERPVGRLGPAARRALGVGYVPEQRLGHATAPELSLAENTLLSGVDLLRRGFLSYQRMHTRAAAIINRFGVVARGPAARAMELSGGNLQKFVLGRELLRNPTLLILVQPTWGLDAAAAAAVHGQLLQLRQAGAAVLVFSDDLDELLALADCIGVLFRGRLSQFFPVADATAERLGTLMSGAGDAA
jgi:simple sugar transport system ATP-binding protein